MGLNAIYGTETVYWITIKDYIATDAFRMAQNPPITTDLELLLTKLAHNGNILRFIPTYQTPEMVAVMAHV